MNRATFIVIHRYAGLLMAVFLVVAGATGVLLAFYDELDAALNSHLHYVEPRGEPLPVEDLIAHVEVGALADKATVEYIRFPKTENRSMEIYVEPAFKTIGSLGFDWIFVDPYTGELLGSRQWGAWVFDRAHVMPLVYRLHYSLALPSPWGMWLFGAAALIWFLDCFTGIYLTFPRRRKQFFCKWRNAWDIKWRAGAARLIRDSHVALSLWLWGMLFVLALSSVMFNLHDEIYKPVVSSLMPFERVRDTLPNVGTLENTPDIGFANAITRAEEELALWQNDAEFSVHRVDAIDYDPAKHAYSYRVHSSLDLPDSFSQTRVYISAADGRLLAREHAYNDAGVALTTWLAALHMGKVFGLWYQIFIAVLAVSVTVVTITGVLVWWRKFRLRVSARSSETILTRSSAEIY